MAEDARPPRPRRPPTITPPAAETGAAAPAAGSLSECELRRQDASWHELVERTQAGWQTPEPFIRRVVRRATGSPLVTQRRLLAGLSNEVYDVATAAGLAVIVRISHRGTPHFEQERWAIDRCREAGVPVPDVLLLEHRRVGGRPLSLCVERKLPGVPLAHVVRAPGQGGPRAVRLLREAGGLLARIHTVPTDGFGPLDAYGRGPFRTWDAFLLDGLEAPERRAHLAALAARSGAGGEAARALEGAITVLLDHRPFLRSRPARLLHHDFEPAHVFVGDGPAAGITGVIDLESCKGGDPAYDLAQWHVIHDAYAPAPLDAGYRAAGAWTAAFETGLRLSVLRFRTRDLLETLEARRDRGPSGAGADRVGAIRTKATRLQHDLVRFR